MKASAFMHFCPVRMSLRLVNEDPMTDPAPQTPKPRSWMRPLLFVSLAGNLLIVGAVAGAMLSPDGPRKRFGEADRALRGVVGEPFFRALPRHERRALERDAIANRDRVRESRASLQIRLDAFLAALRAEPFDRDQVARLMTDQRQAAIMRQELGEELLLNRLSGMSTEDRSAYADALEERLQRFRRR